jgi:iron complex outermembrane receptor protein
MLTTVAFAAPAFAEAANDAKPAAATTETSGVEEIVVTAQRRSENVLNVPLSIQATSGQQLVSAGIKQITDLQFITPGYNVSDSNGYTQIFIRGVGNSIFVGADPSVATFIDDVPRIYGSMVNNFVDVERVEVLKGAQGGLYGRNATGGVVNIITKQPTTEEVKADMRVTYGEKRTFQASGYINIPVNDKIAISFAGERRSHGAYIPNNASPAPYTAAMFPNGGSAFPGVPTNGFTPAQTAAYFNSGVKVTDLDHENFWAGDAKLLLKPSDNLKITIAGDYSNKDDNNGNAQYNISPAYSQAVIGGFFSNFGITANLPAGFVPNSVPKFTVANGNSGFVKLKDYGVSGTIVWNLPGVDITSISAYRHQHTLFTDDLGANPVPVYDALVNNRKHYAYQEFRFASTFDGPLHLIGGGTYLKTYFRGITSGDLLTPLATGLPLADSVDRVKNWSIYGQAAYDFTDHITLTASGRFIHETNNAFFYGSGTPFGATEHKFLPSATLSYKLDGGGNIYARWARGFKSGGVNPVADIAAFGSHPELGGVFKGETVDTYEVGYRGTFFDRKLQVTGAVFYNDYSDLQVAAHAIPTSIILAIVNAGTARTYGAEGSLTWRVNEPITLGINAGYLNAKYKQFAFGDGVILEKEDLSHTQMTNAPKFQLSFNGNLDYPITNDLRLVGNVVVSHSSSVLYQQAFIPGVLPPGVGQAYWLTNMRIGVRTTDDKYGIALVANNLFNTAYQTFGNSSALGSQLGWGNPRIITGEFSVKF